MSKYKGAANDFVVAVGKMQSGTPWGIKISPDLNSVTFNCGRDESYYGCGEDAPYNEVQYALNDGDLVNAIPYLKIFKHLQYLNISDSSITDNGIAQLASAIGAMGVKTLVLANNRYVTIGGQELLKKSLSEVPHEIFVSWANPDGTGTATFNDKSNKSYDLVLEPSGNGNCLISIDPKGLGVSAGDSTCPAPIKDQIVGCIKGAVGGGVTGVLGCGGANIAYPACVASAALLGCAGNTYNIALSPCIDNAYSSVERFVDSSESKSGGFDPHDTPLSGVTVSNEIGGGTPGDFDLGSL